MDNCIKILIADADEGFTSDLACYLKTNSSFDVVGAANDGERMTANGLSGFCAPRSRTF